MKIKISDIARKNINKLPADIRQKVYDKLKGLIAGKTRYKRLQDCSVYSCRTGDYRILFDINHENDYIIRTVRHRREVYRDI